MVPWVTWVTGLSVPRPVVEELKLGGAIKISLRRDSVTLTLVLSQVIICKYAETYRTKTPPFCLFLLSRWNLTWLVFLGFIVSGGGDSKKVELFNPSNGSNCPVSCPFQDMDRIRPYHTSCSGLLCGGGSLPSTKETCVKINGTQITPLPSLTLRQERSGHLCWSLPGEETILLLGSYGRTTEIVSGSSASYSFDLPYYTT